MDMDHDTGVFTGKIIRLISDIRAKHGKDSVDLSECGKFTLAEDLSDISDMTSIDLRGFTSLHVGSQSAFDFLCPVSYTHLRAHET